LIADFQENGVPTTIEADVVIVGAGAAGLCLANELQKLSARVVLLESGGWEEEPRTQSLYETIDTGTTFNSAMTGRFRIFGGTTTKWGGQSLPLMPIDFETRSWVRDSGWPISFSELGGFYDRANMFLDVDRLDYEDQTARLLKVVRPDVKSHGIVYHFSKWAREPNLRKVYSHQLQSSSTVSVLLHANVVGISVMDDNVSSLDISTLDGKRGKVKGKVVILATGALEVARLLLNQPTIASAFDSVLGRYLQDHPAARLGSVETSNPKRLQMLFNGKRNNGRKYSVRLSLSPHKQTEEKILNASAGFVFSLDETSPLAEARRILKKEVPLRSGRSIITAFKCLRFTPSLFDATMQYFAKGQIYLPNARCEIAGSFEQVPDPESRVTLAEDRDSLGMRRLKVNWRISKETLKTARVFCNAIDSTVKQLNVGRFIPFSRLKEDINDAFDPSLFHDQNHHLGTTRMGISVQNSVVDSELRVHNLTNLFIASSSVFPTGGHSNPTLTMLALCIRLADKLKQTFFKR
jgi:choline dehydrogenase-like flavoprotein